MKKFLIALVPVILLCGCFTSEQPFYEQADIAGDDRIVGDYENFTGGHHWHVKKINPGYYSVTLGEESDLDCHMKFTGVLFRLGTNQFLDMLPEVKVCGHGHQDAPSTFDMLQTATIQPMHMVVKVSLGTNEVQIGGLDRPGLISATEKGSDFFIAAKVQEMWARLVPDTKRERDFLIRFGSDTNIFSFQTMKRVSSDK